MIYVLLFAPVLTFVREWAASVIAPAILHGTADMTVLMTLALVKGGSDLTTGWATLACLPILVVIDVAIAIAVRAAAIRLIIDSQRLPLRPGRKGGGLVARALGRGGRRSYVLAVASLVGEFGVRRLAGLLPPLGLTKKINGHFGCTYLFGIPVGRFVVMGRRLVYRRWPIVDELDMARDDGVITGRTRIFDFITFCRFRLIRKRGSHHSRWPFTSSRQHGQWRQWGSSRLATLRQTFWRPAEQRPLPLPPRFSVSRPRML